MLERMHLAIVQEVEKQGSLTAAANVLCLTQSALSHSMRKLEQQLGTDIWLREGRSLRLTQAGQYLLAVAGRVLPQLDQAEDQLPPPGESPRSLLPPAMERVEMLRVEIAGAPPTPGARSSACARCRQPAGAPTGSRACSRAVTAASPARPRPRTACCSWVRAIRASGACPTTSACEGPRRRGRRNYDQPPSPSACLDR